MIMVGFTLLFFARQCFVVAALSITIQPARSTVRMTPLSATSDSEEDRNSEPRYPTKTASERLLDMISTARDNQRAVPLVGVHDALSAKIVCLPTNNRKNYNNNMNKALFVSGFGVSASRLGVPDAGLITRSDMIDTTRNIVSCISSPSSISPPPPVIVDGDTGFGGTANLRKTIRDIASIKGVAAISIEDQMFPKQCAAYDASSSSLPLSVTSRHEAKNRIKTAIQCCKEAYEQDGNRLLLIARTDCRNAAISGGSSSDGRGSLQESIERCLIFQELGADIVYAEGLHSAREYKLLRSTIVDSDSSSSSSNARITPMMLAQVQKVGSNNHQQDKEQKLLRLNDIGEMGYELALFGVTALQATVEALTRTTNEMLFESPSSSFSQREEDGRREGNGLAPSQSLASLDEVKRIVGFPELNSFEQEYGCT